ncbi:hypothetical protein FOL46_006683, partial [Perkinsus olseni]
SLVIPNFPSFRAEFANVTSVLRVATEGITHVLIVEQCNLEEVSLTREGQDAQLCFPQEQALVQWNYTGMFYLTPFSPAARLHLLIAPQICGDGIHVLGEECDGASLGCSSKDCTVLPYHACIGSSYGARRSRCIPINMDGSIYCKHRSCSSLSIEPGPLNGSVVVGRSGSVSAFEKAHIHVKLARGTRAVLGWLGLTTGIGWQCGPGRLDVFGEALSGCRPESSRYLGEIETDEGIERNVLAWRVIDSGKKQDLIIKWSTVDWPYNPGLTTNVSWSMMIIGLRCGDGVHLGWQEQCDDGNEDDDDGCDRACNLAPHRAFTDPHKTLSVEGLTITCSGWHCWRFAVLSEGPHRVVIKHQHLEMTSEEADIGCRCPGIGRRIGIGEVCSYELCPDQQLSRGQLVCGHGASLDGVVPGCVEKTGEILERFLVVPTLQELLTAKPVPAVLLTLEWIAASDRALSVGTFRSTKALLFSVAIVNANLSFTAFDDMSFLTGDLARGLGIEADQLVLRTVVEKTDTRWWSMPAADNRRGAGLYADDGDEKSALASAQFAVALSGFLVILACSVAAIRLRLSEDPAESDEDDEEGDEDIAVVVIEGPNEENKTVDGSDDSTQGGKECKAPLPSSTLEVGKAEELNGGVQVPMIVIQSSPTSEPARPPQESSDSCFLSVIQAGKVEQEQYDLPVLEEERKSPRASTGSAARR